MEPTTWFLAAMSSSRSDVVTLFAPGSAHARLSAQPPIDVSGNFPAHMSRGVGLKFVNVFLINFLAKLGNFKHYFFVILFVKILKVTLQTRVPENFRSRRWRAERRVSRAQTRERGPPSA